MGIRSAAVRQPISGARFGGGRRGRRPKLSLGAENEEEIFLMLLLTQRHKGTETQRELFLCVFESLSLCVKTHLRPREVVIDDICRIAISYF